MKPGASCHDSCIWSMLAVLGRLGAGSTECSFATSARKRSGGMRSDHMQKVFEDASALLGEERFRMKQHAFDGALPYPATHNVPIFTPRRRFKLRCHASGIHH